MTPSVPVLLPSLYNLHHWLVGDLEDQLYAEEFGDVKRVILRALKRNGTPDAMIAIDKWNNDPTVNKTDDLSNIPF